MRARTCILIFILALITVLATPAQAQQPDLHQAGLVVVHGDGRVVTSCVAFSEESISGVDLLRRAGLTVTVGAYAGLGYGVCEIDGEGCPAGQPCFCQCEGSPCAYWAYSHRRPDGSWAISGVGASGWQVHDGDVDGWVWGDGSTAPPVVAFEEVCPPEGDRPAVPTATSHPVSATITPAPLPNVSPASPSPTAAEGRRDVMPEGEAAGSEQSVNPLGYAVFGVVVLGLAVWLIAGRLRGGHGRRHT